MSVVIPRLHIGFRVASSQIELLVHVDLEKKLIIGTDNTVVVKPNFTNCSHVQRQRSIYIVSAVHRVAFLHSCNFHVHALDEHDD